MTRAEYEAARATFRLARGLKRALPVNPTRLKILWGTTLARRYAALMLPVEVASDPLAVPLMTRLYWFRLSRDGIPF